MSAETTLPVCYRHSDRETRLSCSSCGRPVCVDCVRTAAVGQKCLECAAPDKNARVINAGQLARAGLRQAAPVTFWLIVACVGVFVLRLAVPQVFGYGVQANQLVAEGEWWRLVSAAFLHSRGFFHIGFNMYALYVFGPQIERQVGSLPFAALYLGTAMCGGAAYYLFDVLVMDGQGAAVGASGAIFGLFGAMLVGAYRNRASPAGRAGLRQLLMLLAINFALPLLVPIIAWQAHLGGLLAGIAIAAGWTLLGPGRRTAVARTAMGAAAALVALVTVLVV